MTAKTPLCRNTAYRAARRAAHKGWTYKEVVTVLSTIKDRALLRAGFTRSDVPVLARRIWRLAH